MISRILRDFEILGNPSSILDMGIGLSQIVMPCRSSPFRSPPQLRLTYVISDMDYHRPVPHNQQQCEQYCLDCFMWKGCECHCYTILVIGRKSLEIRNGVRGQSHAFGNDRGSSIFEEPCALTKTAYRTARLRRRL